MFFLRASHETTLLTHLLFTCFRTLCSALGAEADVVQNVAANFTSELRLDTSDLVRYRTVIDRNKSMTGLTMEEVSVWSRFAVKVSIRSVARLTSSPQRACTCCALSGDSTVLIVSRICSLVSV